MGFGIKTDLRRHIDAVHVGNKPFRCNICDTTFSRANFAYFLTDNREFPFLDRFWTARPP